jgi:hypothetical protein
MQNINRTRGGKEKMGNAYEGIAQQTARHKRVQTVMHYVNKVNLSEEHRCQEQGKATGIDKVGKAEYGKGLNENLDNLLERMKCFSYRPEPVRRTYIPKKRKQ